MRKLNKICSIEGCSSAAVTRSWCQMHYKRWKAHGDPLRLAVPEDALMKAPNAIDLTGQKFGRLLVVSLAGRVGSGQAQWLCRCECGKETKTTVTKLKAGHTKSCGCFVRGKFAEYIDTRRHKAPRGRKHPLYNTYSKMKLRCHSTKSPDYYLYGARGIAVCDRWRFGERGFSGFDAFLADMGEKPSPNHSLDRYPDNDGPYSPENCRWATAKQQCETRRPARRKA